jgi:hypothetical protein
LVGAQSYCASALAEPFPLLSLGKALQGLAREGVTFHHLAASPDSPWLILLYCQRFSFIVHPLSDTPLLNSDFSSYRTCLDNQLPNLT